MFGRLRSLASSLLFSLLIAASVTGCGKNSSDQGRLDRAMALINKRDYAGASEILAKEHAKFPDDPRIAFLYAESELGLAGFEMFDFIRDLMRGQEPAPTFDLSVKPQCSDGPLADFKGFDMRCIFYRIMQHLPDTNDPHFLKAKMLLHDNFADASRTPVEVNFLISFIDMSSALFSARDILLKSNGHYLEFNPDEGVSEEQFRFVVHSVKTFWSNAVSSIQRLKYSYTKLKKLIYGSKNSAVVKIGGRELDIEKFADSSQIFPFLADVVHDHMNSINEEGNALIGRGLDSIDNALGGFVRQFSRRFMKVGPDGPEIPMVLWQFNQALEFLLRQQGKGGVEANLNKNTPVDLFWAHPPKIFSNFMTAAKEAWDTESRAPLLNYYEETQNEWKALDANLNHWKKWVEQDLSSVQRNALNFSIRNFVANDKRFKLPVFKFSDGRWARWQGEVVTALNEKMDEVLSGRDPTLSTLSEEQKKRGLEILAESEKWINANLFGEK